VLKVVRFDVLPDTQSLANFFRALVFRLIKSWINLLASKDFRFTVLGFVAGRFVVARGFFVLGFARVAIKGV
jgi:hypothetical protein